ncbi:MULTISPECIES: hypothetical protein [Paenibacillus]|uniref:hypothetical protein n=1 Tax=Paenibacillus TaxID=44249 RepID=UPI000B89197A|nr:MULTISPECIES: hypothetical protein [Paenibacillus]MBD8842128.1 hypothetical protein [Paenibacillus sp. CFBP 13594]PQZ97925.1 hypothetical protein CQ043_29560 [Paenibacillus sp. MYb63]PRA42533.1 hypothetical protein CQ061_28715 [Paenibacillus sp. MYb67]QZN77761.1 hypothetical protein K5K90_11545 [Paenibacillus sp. DR312]
MLMKIVVYHFDVFYYYVPNQYAGKIGEWRGEFIDFLQSLEYKHPFTLYIESIDHEGNTEYAHFIRSYGADDFVDWINVEKLNCRGIYRIAEPPDDSEVGLKIDF